MYYEEQWVDGALCWRTSPTGAWTRYTANELAHRYESAEKRAADAQATVEALQAIIKQMGEQACVLAKDGMAAKAQVEALQRERDEWRSNAVAQEARANDLERDCKDLLSDIDGERAKVGDLLKKIAYWEKRHSTYRELAEENMNLKSDELSALQGLVRALQREREKVKGLHEITKVICTHCCEPMEIPSKAVLHTQLTQLQALVRVYSEAKVAFDEGRLREDHHAWKERFSKLERTEAALIDYTMRTLDATPPAADTSIIGKCAPPSQWDMNAQVRGDIS